MRAGDINNISSVNNCVLTKLPPLHSRHQVICLYHWFIHIPGDKYYIVHNGISGVSLSQGNSFQESNYPARPKHPGSAYFTQHNNLLSPELLNDNGNLNIFYKVR